MKQRSEELMLRRSQIVNTLMAEDASQREYITSLEQLLDDYREFVIHLHLRSLERERVQVDLIARTALVFGELPPTRQEPEDEELTDMAKAFRAARLRSDDA